MYASPGIVGPTQVGSSMSILSWVGAQRIWLETIGGEAVGMVGVIQTDDEIEL